MFCLSDVCEILGISNPSHVSSRLEQRGIVLSDTPTSSGTQTILFVNESNLYRVIFRSDKPEAKRFQDWIFNEVIPSIRKTGQYKIPTQNINGTSSGLEGLMALRIIVDNMITHEEKIQDLNTRVTAIEDTQRDSIRAMKSLMKPYKDRPVEEIPLRTKINVTVRAFSLANSLNVQDVWKTLYIEFHKKYHIDLYAEEKKYPNKNKLDIIEERGMLQQLFDIACDICGHIYDESYVDNSK